ncbi:hypothetical protein [Chryseobacterium indoltheticum]|uniref:hypothetical protein n=1 Tax=Chryseobacterium indoltheticum TaxID=254 RepID=UPI003F49A0E7
MKLKLALLALITSLSFSAQSYKVVYDFKWKPQKNATEYLNEDFALIINENKTSEFYLTLNLKVILQKLKLSMISKKLDKEACHSITNTENQNLMKL